ncbi:DUF2975 domain-containing protein [Flavobacterium cerinum]|uniref:DUF2975 domain-containing protein n=1 Tax=Flavobacterium cerinum TaxID=2502784 RepID=A0A444HAA4_9FLAO|nr:DUF2975 domain-containing protein [Flavobacterium cerinum]RWX00218.1 DUF2975 domain-containing protein [Flavobacterium cerinum]
MRKFKILRWAIQLFITICILGICSNIYIYYILSSEPIPALSVDITPYLVSMLNVLLLITGLWYIHQSFTFFIQRSFFNFKSALYLSKGGYIIAATGIISFTYNMTKLAGKSREELITNIILNCLMLIIGFGLTAVADIIKKGESIKQENDLTI